MKKSGILIGSLVTILGAVATATPILNMTTQTAEVCTSLNTCRDLLIEANSRLSILSLHFTEIATYMKNGVPQFHHFSQYEADRYCKSKGQRLPTIRELALYAQAQGAQGISESAKTDSDRSVQGSDSNGKADSFYFNHEGYQHLPGIDSFWIWSSSAVSSNNQYAYVFFLDNGRISGDYERDIDESSLARTSSLTFCVQSPKQNAARLSLRDNKEVCDSVEACRSLQAQAEAKLATFVPSLSKVATNPDGSVRNVTLAEAQGYCRSQGQQLPTIRQLMLFAQSRGALGITEAGVYEPYGHAVWMFDSNGQYNKNYFNYSRIHYLRSGGELGKYIFWSSSPNPEREGANYIWEGTYGDYYSALPERRDTMAVTCVPSH